MQSTKWSAFSAFWCKISIIFLAFFWITGLLFGAYFAFATGNISSLMRIAVQAHVSIVALVAVRIFPLVISAVAVYMRFPVLIIPVALFEAYSVGYIACAAVCAFSGAGWLIWLLLAFSDICSLLPLIWFWVKHISGYRYRLKRDLCVSAAIVLLLCFLDRLFASPYLLMLMNT